MPAARQHGQALVLGMLIVAVAATSLVVLYNLGQTVEGRVRLTHAADAAAYSGALEQARALNAIAYVNRTQIAHQVAMAHLVTLAASAQASVAERRGTIGQRLRAARPCRVSGVGNGCGVRHVGTARIARPCHAQGACRQLQ
ncbi:hypothetical protein G6F22_017889 [Rhizopus arrhizus]|nr:hypothetical protein G6F22_017889 [Rhizopus arrhizus]KAG0933203.1 hypothetical protein G6F31_016371 [Rhizopus arrhizus]